MYIEIEEYQLSHIAQTMWYHMRIFCRVAFTIQKTNSEKSILTPLRLFTFSFSAFNNQIASSVKGTSLYPNLLLSSPILHSPTEYQYYIILCLCTTVFSKSMSDHLRPIIPPILGPVCNTNTN